MGGVFQNVNTIVSQLAFWTGLLSVVLFAVSRFKITLPDSDELSPPLLPRAFTTAFRFWLATCSYVVGYATLYFGLLVIGSFPQLRTQLAALFLDFQNSIDSSGANPATGTPAWAALVATAALPAMPGISGIDQRVRVFLQDFASIPSKARMLAVEMLSALRVQDPTEIDDQSNLETLLAAITAHHERFDQLDETWKELQDVPTAVSRRYRKFQISNQKLMESFERDLSGSFVGITNADTARYIEQKHRDSVMKVARFIACAMLQSDGSELTVRERLQKLGLPVSLAGLNFQLSHIVVSLCFIAVTTVAGCYLSAFLYYCVQHFILQNASADLLLLLREGTPIFFAWTVATVALYTLPITLAAGVAMYVLDRTAANMPTNRIDNLTAAVLTFVGSAILALFVLLAYGVATHIFEKVQWTDLLPWVIPPALVAATFMWMSINPKNLRLDQSETIRYMIVHSSVAIIGSLLAFALWELIGGKTDPAMMNNLPDGLFLYFVVVAAGCIGACIGWVLSGTNQPFRIGNPIRKI
jgi:hypothetical protein